MREILFRGWRRQTNEMFDVLSLDWTGRIGGEITVRLKEYSEHLRNTTFPSDEIVLMQYTGLSDKNGVKIFEGDVCKDRYGKNGAVEYFNDFGGFIVKYELPDRTLHIQLDQGRNKFEVIGNIHDNKNLLK